MADLINERKPTVMKSKLLLISLLLCAINAHAAALDDAVAVIKIALVKQPTSHPFTVAYVPNYKRYYIADGGLGAVMDGYSIARSRSEIHTFSAKGEYINSIQGGLDNRSIYFNPNDNTLETVTYNVSSGGGFTPDVGIYTLELDNTGNLTQQHAEKFSFNPAFGDAGVIPSFDNTTKGYYAKQSRSNKVFFVLLDKREPVSEILLDLKTAGVEFDDIADNYVAYTGIPNEELAVLDIDHKAVLLFNLKGVFTGRSKLPSQLKLHAQNHYSGLGYANGLFFVYNQNEGDFGTYYGFKVSDQAVNQ
ncbi:MAG TPA: hypothetical protein VIE69_05925 [Methylophilaceae bacterium]